MAFSCADLASREQTGRPPQPERRGRTHESRFPGTLPGSSTWGLHTGMPPSLPGELPGAQHRSAEASLFQHMLAQEVWVEYLVLSEPAVESRSVLLHVQICGVHVQAAEEATS